MQWKIGEPDLKTKVNQMLFLLAYRNIWNCLKNAMKRTEIGVHLKFAKMFASFAEQCGLSRSEQDKQFVFSNILHADDTFDVVNKLFERRIAGLMRTKRY